MEPTESKRREAALTELPTELRINAALGPATAPLPASVRLAEGDTGNPEPTEGGPPPTPDEPELGLTLRFMTDEDIEHGEMYRYNPETRVASYKTLVLRLNPADHDPTFINTYGATVMLNHSSRREDVLGKIVRESLRVVKEKGFTSLQGDVVLSKHNPLALRIYNEIQDGIGTYASMLVQFDNLEIIEETDEKVVVTATSWYAQNIGLVFQGAYPRAGAVGDKFNKTSKNTMDPIPTNAGTEASSTPHAGAELLAVQAELSKAKFDAALTKLMASLQTKSITKEQYDTIHTAVLAASIEGADCAALVKSSIAEAVALNAKTASPAEADVTASENQAVAGKPAKDTADLAKRNIRCNVILNLARTGGRKLMTDAKVDFGVEQEFVQEQRNSGQLKRKDSVGLPLENILAEKASAAALRRGDIQKAHDLMALAAGTSTSTGYPAISTEDRLPALFQEALRDDSAMADFMPRVVTLANESEFALQNDTVSGSWVSGDTITDTASQRVGTEARKLVFRTIEVVSQLTRKGMALVNAPALYDITINDIVREFNELLFKAVLNGSGINGEPRGILNTTGITAITPGIDGAGAARVLRPSWAQAQSYIYTVMANLQSGTAVNPSNACFITTPQVIQQLVTTPIDAGSGWFVGDMRMGMGMPTIAGYKVIPYTGLTNRQLIFGKPDQGVLGFFSSTVEVREDNDVGGGGLVLRTYWDADYTVARPEGFVYTNIV